MALHWELHVSCQPLWPTLAGVFLCSGSRARACRAHFFSCQVALQPANCTCRHTRQPWFSPWFANRTRTKAHHRGHRLTGRLHSRPAQQPAIPRTLTRLSLTAGVTSDPCRDRSLLTLLYNPTTTSRTNPSLVSRERPAGGTVTPRTGRPPEALRCLSRQPARVRRSSSTPLLHSTTTMRPCPSPKQGPTRGQVR